MEVIITRGTVAFALLKYSDKLVMGKRSIRPSSFQREHLLQQRLCSCHEIINGNCVIYSFNNNEQLCFLQNVIPRTS